jgi:hypothetical protein
MNARAGALFVRHQSRACALLLLSVHRNFGNCDERIAFCENFVVFAEGKKGLLFASIKKARVEENPLFLLFFYILSRRAKIARPFLPFFKSKKAFEKRTAAISIFPN